jgi:hypothetical protein
MSSPLVGLVLISEAPPVRPSPPMNSLPPRLCPPIGLEGVTGVAGNAVGDSCGEVAVAVAGGADGPAGLKLKSGRALIDLPLAWAEPRRPVGYAWSDIGRALAEGAGVDEAVSGSRMGKEKSGFGVSSMGPVWDGRRRWYSGEPTWADCCVCVTCCRGSAI